MKLYSDSRERHIVVKDENTKSGYRILSDYSHLWNGKEYYAIEHRYIFIPTPDYPFGYILMSLEYDKIKFYHEIVEIFETKKEATDYVHEHRRK